MAGAVRRRVLRVQQDRPDLVDRRADSGDPVQSRQRSRQEEPRTEHGIEHRRIFGRVHRQAGRTPGHRRRGKPLRSALDLDLLLLVLLFDLIKFLLLFSENFL